MRMLWLHKNDIMQMNRHWYEKKPNFKWQGLVFGRASFFGNDKGSEPLENQHEINIAQGLAAFFF